MLNSITLEYSPSQRFMNKPPSSADGGDYPLILALVMASLPLQSYTVRCFPNLTRCD